MYDFANSGYTTVILTAVFSTYFVGVVGARASWATLAWTAALSLSYLLIMLTMPTLGARADARAAKRRLLFASTVGCVGATLALTQAGPGDVWLALVAIVISNYCYCVGESVVAAFLPELARPAALGRVSGWGWSFGYCGGMLTLGLSLVVVTQAEARGMTAEHFVPWVIVVTCSVFALAALPSFFLLRERASGPGAARHGPAAAPGLCLARDGTHFPEFRRLLMCIACYQAGISVVITLAAVYASEVMGFTTPQIMLLVFTVNIGAAAAFVRLRAGSHRPQARAGHHAVRLDPDGAGGLCGRDRAGVLGRGHAGRPVHGHHAERGPRHDGALAAGRLAEFFSLWTFAVQLAAVIGPLTYGLVTWATDGNHRLAILVTGLFFVGGLALLSRVDMARGLARRGQAPLPERRHRRHIGRRGCILNCATPPGTVAHKLSLVDAASPFRTSRLARSRP